MIKRNVSFKLWLAMKLAVFLLFCFSISAVASVHAQKVSLDVKNTSLNQVLRKLRQQTGYSFLFKERDMIQALPVDLSVKNMEIDQVLPLLFENQPLSYSIEDRVITVRRKPHSAGQVSTERSGGSSHLILAYTEVRGRVTDSLGRPLSGATIRVLDGSGRRTALATTSDREGEFVLQHVPEDARVEVTFVGYLTRSMTARPALGQIVLQVVPSSLDAVEVMVSTGYQTLPKERATGSFEVLDMKKFDETVGSNVLDRLEGLATSLQFDRSTASGLNKTRLSIRGFSTIEGPQEVLVVVDNFPFEGDINTINPNEIESITLLKDAAASSIWGTRAGNGVIVIVTKKGKFSSRLSSNFRTTHTLGSDVRLDRSRTLSSKDYIEFERFKFGLGHKVSDVAHLTRPVYASPVYELLIRARDGQLTTEELDLRLDALSQNNLFQQYEDLVYSNKFNRQYAWDMSSGNDRFSWLGSIVRDDNNSELKEKFSRTGLSFSTQIKPIIPFQISLGMRYSNTVSRSGHRGYDSEVLPYARLADDEGAPVGYAKLYRQSFMDNLGNGLLKDWNYYPLTDSEHQRSNVRTDHLLTNIQMKYTLWDQLNLSGFYQYELQDVADQMLYREQSYFARNLINSYAQVTNGNVKFVVPEGSIMDLKHSKLEVHNLRFQLDWNKEWKHHKFTGLAGFEARERKLNSDYVRRYGYSELYNSYLPHDPIGRYPHFVTNSTSLIPSSDGFTDANNRFLSGYVNLAYTLSDKYSITASARRDASNLFGLNVNDSWNLLWSSGLAWTVDKESWFVSPFIDRLKIRATYGFSGNVDPSKSAVTTMTYHSSLRNQYVNQIIGHIGQYANPELRWEKVRMINLATDFAMLNNQLRGSFDFYIKKSTDLFGPAEMDYTAGVNSSVVKNTASLEGKGVDLNLEFDAISKGDFIWTPSLLFSYYNDKIVSYYLNTSNAVSAALTASKSSYSRITGNPLFSMYSYQWAGLDPSNGDPMAYLEGKPTADFRALSSSKNFDELVFSGSTIPTFFGSLTNTFRYKEWSASIRLQYSLGYYFRRNTINYLAMFDRPDAAHPDYLQRWQKPGDENWTNIPSLQYPVNTARTSVYTHSELTVERGDHIRLQQVSVGRNFRIGSIDFFGRLAGEQLGVIWRKNKLGIDPVYQNATYAPPALWSLTFGVNL